MCIRDSKNLNPWLNLLRDDLDLKGVAMGFNRIPAGRGYTFMHQHETQEEVYVVLSGKGLLYIDGEHIDLSPGDIVKVDPIAKRASRLMTILNWFVLFWVHCRQKVFHEKQTAKR